MAVDSATFKQTLAHWASGVTVVTSCDGAHAVGITASSFSSVSLEPPRVLICVAKRLYTHGVIEHYGAFAANILGVEQLEWGMRFAGLIPEIEDRFAGIEWKQAVTGCPVFPGAVGWVDCRLVHAFDGGDHTIFVGDVEAGHVVEGRQPLLYFNRHWRHLDPEVLHLPRTD
jgi:flavin reductase (DIM6/NTAB) family NADH-FMN oxidoreductase RutF